jgi:peptidoglycan/xylan/chitin deacetylase (PgdA/CDA1 family)
VKPSSRGEGRPRATRAPWAALLPARGEATATGAGRARRRSAAAVRAAPERTCRAGRARRALTFAPLGPRLLVLAFAVGALPACATAAQGPAPRVRFLLTFDDGPSPEATFNSTARVLESLAHNPVQDGIKAVFFVQTRWPGAGGSEVGHALLRRALDAGHLLGLHSGSARGHVDHTALGAAELRASLASGAADLEALSGEAPGLVRPPNWRFDAATLEAYREAGLQMLLTDASARDGSWVLFQVDPQTGGRLRCDLQCHRARVGRGSIPEVDGVFPVVVTFHDVNGYTAEHLVEYLQTLLRAAQEAGFSIARPAFYGEPDALRRVAQARAQSTQAWRNAPLRSCPP